MSEKLHYSIRTFNLASAHTDEPLPIVGDNITVLEMTGTNFSIKLNNRTADSIDLTKAREVKTPFRRIFYTNTAQTGKQIILAIGGQLGIKAVEETPNTPTIYNVTMTNLNTEYSQALPANCRKFIIHTRDGTAFRLAFVTGKVATPTAPYWSNPSNADYWEESLKISSLTLYFACAVAGKVIEIIAWVV